MKNVSVGRWLSCSALLALLGACGYAGAKTTPVQTVSVPVIAQMIPQEATSLEAMAQAGMMLDMARETALARLQEVIDHPDSAQDTVRYALEEKARITSCAQKEAALGALLAQMGFGHVTAVIGEESVSVIAPWQTAENEQSRMQIIDAAAAQTGFSAEQVKIILAKK